VVCHKSQQQIHFGSLTLKIIKLYNFGSSKYLCFLFFQFLVRERRERLLDSNNKERNIINTNLGHQNYWYLCHMDLFNEEFILGFFFPWKNIFEHDLNFDVVMILVFWVIFWGHRYLSRFIRCFLIVLIWKWIENEFLN
jgi:hypothetical protein